MLTFRFLLGSGIRCIRDRSPSVSEYSRFAGKWTRLQRDRLQDLFQGLFEELPDGGVSWKLHIWQSRHTCSGNGLIQHPAGRQAAFTAQLHLAGKRTCPAVGRMHFYAAVYAKSTRIPQFLVMI